MLLILLAILADSKGRAALSSSLPLDLIKQLIEHELHVRQPPGMSEEPHATGLAHQHEIKQIADRIEAPIPLDPGHLRPVPSHVTDIRLIVVAGHAQLERGGHSLGDGQRQLVDVMESLDLHFGVHGQGESLARDPFEVEHPEITDLAFGEYGTEDRHAYPKSSTRKRDTTDIASSSVWHST